jgi:molybdopterin-biosynthesis enzyme MoeA-like protein
MAWLPEGAALISNPFGAPGFHVDGIYAFPGFPHMLKSMVEDTLPHIVSPHGQASSWIVRELELSVPEGEIAAEIEAFARQHPEGRLGLYPSLQSGSPKVTIRLRVSERNSHVLRDFENLVDKLNAKFN